MRGLSLYRFRAEQLSTIVYTSIIPLGESTSQRVVNRYRYCTVHEYYMYM